MRQPRARIDRPELAAATLKELGLDRSTIDKLQELPYERIVEAGLDRATEGCNPTPAAPGTGGGVNWGPVVDGKVLPEHPWDPKGSPLSADVPLLVGTVLNEFANSIQAGDPTLDDMTMEEAKKRLTAQRGDKADQILETFRSAAPQGDALRAVLAHQRDDAPGRTPSRRRSERPRRAARRRICTGSSGRRRARRPSARVPLLGTAVRLLQHRSLRGHDRRRTRGARSRRQDCRRLDGVRADRQPQPQGSAQVAGVHGGAVPDDGLRYRRAPCGTVPTTSSGAC